MQRSVMFLVSTAMLVPVLVKAASSAPPFSYDQTNSALGPAAWGNSYPSCASSVPNQSPIDFSNEPLDDSVPAPQFVSVPTNGAFGCQSWTQVPTSYDFSINFASAGCQAHFMTYSGQIFTLQSMRFVTPSGHAVGSGHYDAEVEFWHQNPQTNQYAVVSVFLTASRGTGLVHMKSNNNTFLAQLWKAGGNWNPIQLKTTTITPANSGGSVLRPYLDFLPGSLQHFQYTGSLTIPPCTPNVLYFVMRNPVRFPPFPPLPRRRTPPSRALSMVLFQILIAAYDMLLLRQIPTRIAPSSVSPDGDFSRPLQPVGNRVIKFCDGTTTNGAFANVPTAATTVPASAVPPSTVDPQTGVTLGALAFVIASIALGIALMNWAKIAHRGREVVKTAEDVEKNPLH